MTIDIENFRTLTQSSAHRVLVDQHSTSIIKAPETKWGRLVAWVKRLQNKAPDSAKQSNRTSFDQFRTALKETYGESIANNIDRLYLKHRYVAGGNLSSHTIADALDTADLFRNMTIGVNSQRLREFSGSRLAKVFKHTTNGSMQSLNRQERAKLRSKVQQAIRNDPLFRAGKMAARQMAQIAQGVIQNHQQAKESTFDTKFPQLSRTPANRQANSIDAIQKQLNGLANSSDKSIQLAAQQLQLALQGIDAADEILAQAPMSSQEIDAYHQDLAALSETLITQQQSLSKLHDHPNQAVRELAMAMLHDINRPLEQVISKKEYLTAFQNNRPMSAQNVHYAKKALTNAAVQLIDEQIKHSKTSMQRLQLNSLKQQLQNELQQDAQDAALSKEDQQEWTVKQHKVPLLGIRHGQKGGREKFVASLLTRMQAAGVSSENLEKDLEEAHTDALNKMDWQPINSQVKFTLKGQQHTVQSSVTPARHVADEQDPLTQSYIADGINGVSSESDHIANHALNGATSTLKNENGAEIFNGVRHGIHSTRGLEKGSPQRRAANLNHAKETIQLALHGNPALLQQAIQAAGAEPPGVIDMPMSSLSLVTPSKLNDKVAWDDQLQAWQDINNLSEPLSFDVKAPDGNIVSVKIKPKVLAFNFGVNPLAMASGSGRGALSPGWGWDSADKTNKESLQTLLGGLDPKDHAGGMVGDYLKRNDVSPQDKQIVRELTRQVREIWTSGSHRHKEGDLFKMTSRLAVLTHRIGATPLWNCRSGKDRTGHLDVEAKMLAAEIHYTGQVPDYGPLSDERKTMFSEFAMHTGNLEIQQYNTGLPGYKTENMQENLDRLHSAAAQNVYASGAPVVPH